jgi:glycerol-3-phosphate dehydrogenase
MERNPAALSKTRFDLVVIGGGINGAATAREAALRGLKVALVEAGDFAVGTSSRSSKLIHGGLRYLEQFDFRLVRESRLERRLLFTIAPHLAQPLPFLLPIYHGDPYYPLKIRVGLTLYDLLGSLGSADRHRMLSPAEALEIVPGLRPEGLRAGAVYHDSATDDARLTIEMVTDAVDRGAVVANYTEVRALSLTSQAGSRAGEVVTAEAQDRLTGRRYELSARYWVNATGPWVDHVRALVPGFDGSRTIRLTKGTHLILPELSPHHALFAAIPSDDRIFLMLPWNGYSLLGTTDTDYQGDPASVQADCEDTEYLLNAVNRVLSRPIAAGQVLGCFAGLRALVIEPGERPSANTREHRFHQDPWAWNFLSICGGKLTTARALGEKMVDGIVDRLDPSPGIAARRHPSRQIPLPGGRTGPFQAFVLASTERAAAEYGLPRTVAERIVRTYGSRWPLVLGPVRENPQLAEPLQGKPTLLAAEVEFAIRHEMAVTLEDFLLRRSGMNWAACTPAGGEAAPAVARIFARHFGWDPERRKAALENFAKLVSSGVRES